MAIKILRGGPILALFKIFPTSSESREVLQGYATLRKRMVVGACVVIADFTADDTMHSLCC
jgi:hypothetical protein